MDDSVFGLRVQVFGKVQGVFFRQSTKDQADHLGLKGSVENLENGSVMVHIFGRSERVSELLLWLHTGPQDAHVDYVHSEILNRHMHDGFIIL